MHVENNMRIFCKLRCECAVSNKVCLNLLYLTWFLRTLRNMAGLYRKDGGI
jgi:hypothetical protein